MRILYLLMVPVAIVVAGLASCEDRFRYACQDPDNWDTKQCQKPYCDVTQTCPEHVFADQRKIQEQLEPKPPTVGKEPKNECPK